MFSVPKQRIDHIRANEKENILSEIEKSIELTLKVVPNANWLTSVESVKKKADEKNSKTLGIRNVAEHAYAQQLNILIKKMMHDFELSVDEVNAVFSKINSKNYIQR